MKLEEAVEIVKVDGSIETRLKAITEHHKYVSDIETPKPYIKKKAGMDYVEIGYMKGIADKEFPGWSWTIINSEALGSEAYVVHGRLEWYDNGTMRKGDMVAAHRIQTKRGTTEFVDVGNDIKAANTDCMKKAFNMYLNISDDVYRNQIEDMELSDDKVKKILKTAKKAGMDTVIEDKIDNGEIHGMNYKVSLAKLERLANDKK